MMIRSAALAILLTAAGAAALPMPAQACAMLAPARQPSAAERFRQRVGYARSTVAGATAIIDGEVVRPQIGDQPALVRAERVLRGPARQYFEVGQWSSCANHLHEAGERLRLILVDGPDVYRTDADQSNAYQEDRLIGSDRRRVWPSYLPSRDGPQR